MSYLRSLFLKLLDGPFVNPTTLVDEMASGGGLARVDVADNHDVNVEFFLAHDCLSFYKRKYNISILTWVAASFDENAL